MHLVGLSQAGGTAAGSVKVKIRQWLVCARKALQHSSHWNRIQMG